MPIHQQRQLSVEHLSVSDIPESDFLPDWTTRNHCFFYLIGFWNNSSTVEKRGSIDENATRGKHETMEGHNSKLIIT